MKIWITNASQPFSLLPVARVSRERAFFRWFGVIVSVKWGNV